MNQVITLPTIDRIAKFSRIAQRNAAGAFQYRFDDMGIEVDGSCVGSFNGTANVTYHEDEGELRWFVHEIYLDGHRGETVEIERTHWLYIPLWGALVDGRKDSIEAKVQEQL